jgi:hypothetical protein
MHEGSSQAFINNYMLPPYKGGRPDGHTRRPSRTLPCFGQLLSMCGLCLVATALPGACATGGVRTRDLPPLLGHEGSSQALSLHVQAPSSSCVSCFRQSLLGPSQAWGGVCLALCGKSLSCPVYTRCRSGTPGTCLGGVSYSTTGASLPHCVQK